MTHERLTVRRSREIIWLKEETGLSNRAIGWVFKMSNSTVGEYHHPTRAYTLHSSAALRSAGEVQVVGRVSTQPLDIYCKCSHEMPMGRSFLSGKLVQQQGLNSLAKDER